MPVPSAPATLPRFRHRWLALAGLLVLSPISAEYLIGYGDSTGRPLALLTGLLILAPLYGTVAVLIREVTRRTDRGWPTILLLSAAFGVIQAGLIDQTLFDNQVDADGPDWAASAVLIFSDAAADSTASPAQLIGGVTGVVWCVPIRAGLSFLVEPLGSVDGPVKYVVNAVMLGGVVILLLVAAHRLHRLEPSEC